MGWGEGGTMPSETYQGMLVRGSEGLHMAVIIGNMQFKVEIHGERKVRWVKTCRCPAGRGIGALTG